LCGGLLEKNAERDGEPDGWENRTTDKTRVAATAVEKRAPTYPR
jgi:hypothetical protein